MHKAARNKAAPNDDKTWRGRINSNAFTRVGLAPCIGTTSRSLVRVGRQRAKPELLL